MSEKASNSWYCWCTGKVVKFVKQEDFKKHLRNSPKHHQGDAIACCGINVGEQIEDRNKDKKWHVSERAMTNGGHLYSEHGAGSPSLSIITPLHSLHPNPLIKIGETPATSAVSGNKMATSRPSNKPLSKISPKTPVPKVGETSTKSTASGNKVATSRPSNKPLSKRPPKTPVPKVGEGETYYCWCGKDETRIDLQSRTKFIRHLTTTKWHKEKFTLPSTGVCCVGKRTREYFDVNKLDDPKIWEKGSHFYESHGEGYHHLKQEKIDKQIGEVATGAASGDSRKRAPSNTRVSSPSASGGKRSKT